MSFRFPLNSKWTQSNTSDKFGSIAYSKCINLDEDGYLKLSPRIVNFYDETATYGSSNFDIPVAFGRYTAGSMRIATIDEPFNLSVDETGKTIAEDTGSDNPNLTTSSHGVWFKGAFHETTSNNVRSNTAGTWTTDLITNLSSTSVRHAMAVFKNKNSLAISDGNLVKLYDSSYALTITLTLPSDFEVMGLAYNNNKLGIITRLGNDSAGQNSDSYFFVWDGATTSANAGYSIGTGSAFAITPYKSSFAFVTSAGQLLYFNGGGFEELEHFPFYSNEQRLGDFLSVISYGDNMVVDGDVIYINVGFTFDSINKRQETYVQNNPSGIWCYDPSVGLYHKYAPSNSRVYSHQILSANVNTTTDTFTTSSTIPTTGALITQINGVTGGLKKGMIYYVIRISDTTFKIAETKEDAIAGNWINITSADTVQTFYMYDIIDYGATIQGFAGAIGLWGTSKLYYRDVIFGSRILDTSLENQATLCSAVPFLENRGYVVLPRLFTSAQTENIQGIVIKHKPLDIYDSIIVKFKNKAILGLPASAPNGMSSNELTWTSSTTATTNSNLEDIKTAFDNGEELEIELTAGIGAGQMSKITNITESTGTYTITIQDEVIGYTVGLKSYFIIDNWKVFDSVDYSSQKDGIFEVPIADIGKSPQVKIELRGYNTTIEDMSIISEPHQPLR